MRRSLPILILGCAFALPVSAEQVHKHTAPEPTAKAAVKRSEKPSTSAYRKSMHRMHREMMSVPNTGRLDRDFVAGMIPHHQGAVRMAEVELKYGKDEEMRDLAKFIIMMQEQEIAFMKRWLERRGGRAVNTKLTSFFDDAMHRMHKGMDIRYTGDADVDFARGMIPHHQGAIDMAELILKEGSDPEIIDLAEGIVRSQKAEIGKMQRWLERQNGKK